VLYELHVFGLNLSAVPAERRSALALTRPEAARVLRSLAGAHASLEAVVVRARNHVEAFVAAPLEEGAARAWARQLRHVRPDLLQAGCRPLHYHLCGPAAARHLALVARGGLAPNPDEAVRGVKAALGLAARCGTLGETLDGLFVRALSVPRAPRRQAPTRMQLGPLAL